MHVCLHPSFDSAHAASEFDALHDRGSLRGFRWNRPAPLSRLPTSGQRVQGSDYTTVEVSQRLSQVRLAHEPIPVSVHAQKRLSCLAGRQTARNAKDSSNLILNLRLQEFRV